MAPEVQTGAQLLANGKNWSTRVLGVTDAYSSVRNTEVAQGDWISRQQVDARSSVVVLSFGIYPATRASRLNPIGAPQYE